MRRLPVRLRLTLAFAVAMAVVLSLVGLFVYRRVASELMNSVDLALHANGAEAVNHAGREPNLVDQDVTGGTTLAQLLDAHGKIVVSQTSGIGPLLTPAQAAQVASGAHLLRTESVSGRRGKWRVLGLPASAGVVAVARPLSPQAESLDHLRHELILILPLALVAASVGGYLLAAGALHPVEAMRRRAEAVTAAEPGLLPVPPSRDELARLAVTLNDMLVRLQESFQHERRFVADASHELRTPLALLRAELELALRRPRTHEELTDALRSAAEETVRLSRLAEDLLLIARADHAPLPLHREHVPAEEVLASVAARFATRASSLGRDLRVEPSAVVVDADSGRIEQALGNLVDNALAYGAGAVVLGAVQQRETVELHVRDEGPGLPDGFAERAFDRFSRADEARGHDGSSAGGAGLGLSIVETIARAHGGSAGIGNRPGGGVDAWVSLPVSPSGGGSPGAFAARGREDAGPGRVRPERPLDQGRVDAPTEDHAEMKLG